MSEIRKASELRPWLKHFPEAFINMPTMCCTLEELIRTFNKKLDGPAIEYYGTTFSMNDMFAKADECAKALAAAGVKCGDHLTVFMQFQPEFMFLLLAAEKIGAALVCRDGVDEDYVNALQVAKGPLCFIQDDFTKEQEQLFYDSCPELKHIVTFNPFTYAVKETMPDYILANIDKRYSETSIINNADERTMTWTQLIAGAEGFTGDYIAPRDPDRNLYHPFTSGSTGPSKEIMHCARTMTGILGQLCPMMTQIPFTMRCMMPTLPPALIAMVVPIVLLYTSTGHTEILNPYMAIEDHDLELMRYMPNGTVAVSNLGRALLDSKRIPADFQFPQLMQIGGGAEASDNKLLKRFAAWLQQHGAKYAKFTMGFGQTEAGPVIATAASFCEYNDLKCGIPLPKNIVGIFDEDCNEIDYASVGEVCVCSPGVMKGYAKEEDTKKALKVHADGRTWLHTGDMGFFNDEGELTVVSRGWDKTWMGGNLYLMVMENKIVELPGIDDCFFVAVPDAEHEGYKVPYLYLIPEEGAVLADIEAEMKDALEPYEYPVEIRIIKERPWFHFKTYRIGLVREILAEREAAKAAQ